MLNLTETLKITDGQEGTTVLSYRVADAADTAEKHIGLTGCAPCSTHPVITVRKRGTAPYSYIARKARLLTRWITVKADSLFHAVFSSVSSAFRFIFRNSGVKILRQSAILRI